MADHDTFPGKATERISINVLGVHPIEYRCADVERAIGMMWDDGLTGPDLENARRQTREHFDQLRLIVIDVIPSSAELDWTHVSQPVAGVDRDNWQAPYAEERTDADRGRWAFFLHFVQPHVPLHTPAGELPLPADTPLPAELRWKRYEPPG